MMKKHFVDWLIRTSYFSSRPPHILTNFRRPEYHFCDPITFIENGVLGNESLFIADKFLLLRLFKRFSFVPEKWKPELLLKSLTEFTENGLDVLCVLDARPDKSTRLAE